MFYLISSLSVTRSMLKKIKMISSRVQTIINFSFEKDVRITRSISKSLNIIGLALTQRELPSAKIVRRRHTTGNRNPRRRSNRIQSVPHQRFSPEPELWCICRLPDDGSEMIFCENSNCLVQWFHVKCMKMSTIPENSWYCPNCILMRIWAGVQLLDETFVSHSLLLFLTMYRFRLFALKNHLI